MENLFKIDGYDMYEAFGFIVAEGSDDFLRLPTSKDKPSYDWPDDVTEYDLSSPAFHPREANLIGAIHATSEADFWSKYNALWQMLSAPGERVIEVVELGQSFAVFYKENPTNKRYTPIIDSDNVIVQMTITFQVIGLADGVEPGGNGGFVAIKNQESETVALVQAPGEYEVIELSGIQDDGSGVYQNSIIDNV